MLCSARELGLSDDASGLLELPADLPTGQPLSDALDLDDDVLGFNLTPNRGDCMSVLGIAREVAALGGQALAAPAIAAVAAARHRSGAGRADTRCGLRALRLPRDPGSHARRPGAPVDARAAPTRRAAPDQRGRRRHQLRDARARSADARL